MKKISQAITLKKVSAKDEIEFLIAVHSQMSEKFSTLLRDLHHLSSVVSPRMRDEIKEEIKKAK